MSETITTAPPSKRDATELAALHSELIGDGFLSSLGPRFLSILYRHFGDDHSTVLVRATDSHGNFGLAAMSEDLRRTYRAFVLRHGISAGLATAPAILRPTGIRRLAETVRASGVGSTSVEDGQHQPSSLPVLMNFCVSDRRQRSGIGKAMLAEAASWLACRGHSEFIAVTGANQSSAVEFYRHLGAMETGATGVHQGVDSIRFITPIQPLIEYRRSE